MENYKNHSTFGNSSACRASEVLKRASTIAHILCKQRAHHSGLSFRKWQEKFGYNSVGMYKKMYLYCFTSADEVEVEQTSSERHQVYVREQKMSLLYEALM